MDPIVKLVYKCYLGKTMEHRLAAISRLVKKLGGREKFFNKYSTQKDSIMGFLKKIDAAGLKL